MQEAVSAPEEIAALAVMPGTVELLAALRERLALTIPLLSDPEWDTHRRYGMRRGSRRDILLSPATWKAYARLARSWRLTRPTEDVFQLGGTAVIDAEGLLAWIHRSKNPADYADPGEIVRVARSPAMRRLA